MPVRSRTVISEAFLDSAARTATSHEGVSVSVRGFSLALVLVRTRSCPYRTTEAEKPRLRAEISRGKRKERRRTDDRRRRMEGSWLREAADRGCFVFVNVEDGVELGDLQQILDALSEIEELQLSAAVGHGGETRHQLADPRAVDIRHIAQVQQDLLIVFGDQVAQRIAHGAGALTQGNASSYVN